MSRYLLILMFLFITADSYASPPGDYYITPPQPSGEEPSPPPTIEEHLESAMNGANKYSAWNSARHDFYDAFIAKNEAAVEATGSDDWVGEPGLLFNLAVCNDRAGGRRLPAILWYRAFIESAPTSELVPQVRKRVKVLTRELNNQFIEEIEFLEKIFREVQLTHDAEKKAHDRLGTTKSRQAVKEDGWDYENAVGGLESTRIFLGDLKTAKRMIRTFGVENKHSDAIAIAFMAVKKGKAARDYGGSDKNFGEIKKLIKAMRTRARKSCSSFKKQQSFINTAAQVENLYRTYSFSNYGLTYKPDLVKLRKDNKDAYPWRYVKYAERQFALGMRYWKYIIVDQECE